MRTAAEHWNAVYETRAAEPMSWFQATADISLALVREGNVGTTKAISMLAQGPLRWSMGFFKRPTETSRSLMSRKLLWMLPVVV
jgi:hypothetical protein